MTDPYKFADEQIAKMREAVNNAFSNAMLLMRFDKINLISEVKTQTRVLFYNLDELNKRFFRKVVRKAYEDAVEEVREGGFDVNTESITGMLEGSIEGVLSRLYSDIHPMTGYSYRNETERKRDRLFETVFAASAQRTIADASEQEVLQPILHTRTQERVRIAMTHGAKLWYGQSRQYIDLHVDEGRKQAFEDAGVTWVEWVTRKDEKVCEECNALNGMVFKIGNVPPKPHRNCRCTIRPFNDQD